MQSRAFSGLLVIGLLTVVYFIAGKFGLMLASLHASASPVWPPAGIALGALLVLGYRAWPAIFVGALIILWSIASKRRWNRSEAVEAGILLLLLLVLSEAVFCGWLTIPARNYPFPFVIFGPIAIWTAFRFAQRETATGIFILSAFAIWGTMHGFGPFVGETKNQSLLSLQSWTTVLTITA